MGTAKSRVQSKFEDLASEIEKIPGYGVRRDDESRTIAVSQGGIVFLSLEVTGGNEVEAHFHLPARVEQGVFQEFVEICRFVDRSLRIIGSSPKV